MPITFDCPNLDDQPPGDLEVVSNVLLQLAQYAKAKSTAMRHRLAGRINTAVRIENQCDQLYDSLPEWARW